MVLPQAMAWVQYWFRILSLKFCGKSKKKLRRYISTISRFLHVWVGVWGVNVCSFFVIFLTLRVPKLLPGCFVGKSAQVWSEAKKKRVNFIQETMLMRKVVLLPGYFVTKLRIVVLIMRFLYIYIFKLYLEYSYLSPSMGRGMRRFPKWCHWRTSPAPDDFRKGNESSWTIRKLYNLAIGAIWQLGKFDNWTIWQLGQFDNWAI